MPPFQSRSTGARRIARTSSSGSSAAASTPSAARASGESGTDFSVRDKTPPPGEIAGAVVVHPRGAGPEREEARALGERRGRVGRRVEEDVAVVEGRDQVDLARQQHAVAEHVARHVADADDGERARVDVAAELAEVPLARSPRRRAP